MKNLIDNEGSDYSENEESDSTLSELEEFAHAVYLCRTSSNNEKYVTNISATRDSHPKVAIASSGGSLEIQTLTEKFCVDLKLSNDLNHVVEMKFDKINSNLLWTAVHDGTINLWDLRYTNKAASSFSDTSDEQKNKKFNCFDISSCGRVLCAGTNKCEEDSFLLFWDIRKCSLAGGFWESHMDDITQVKFHPSDPNKMYSASTDGLINVYDLSQSSEDDALVDTLNTESSVEKISFQIKNQISCITHTADIQFWKEEGVQPYLSFKRKELAKSLKRKSGDDVHIIDVHPTNCSSFILANCDTKQVVRGLELKETVLKPSFRLLENQQMLRCSWYNENTKLLLTGGEGGFVDAWTMKNIL